MSNNKPVPSKARAVIIGGGIAGCSVAYHLAKLGWKDVVLLERKRLTSGTTWHAAGLIAQLRATKNMTRLAKYSQELYGKLEEETGVATGFRRNGSITVALTDERREEIYRQTTMARAFGVDVEEISNADVKERYPHLNIDDVKGAVYLPLDGQGDPANIAMALAKGARQNGAQIIEGVKVTAIHKKGGRVTGVSWARDGVDESGEIDADIVVNCGGMWGHEVGRMAGVTVPLHACEHFYIVTENIPDLPKLPTLRVPDECAYYKEDAGKILLGAFEPVAKPWGMDGIPDDFCFDQLPEDFDLISAIQDLCTYYPQETQLIYPLLRLDEKTELDILRPHLSIQAASASLERILCEKRCRHLLNMWESALNTAKQTFPDHPFLHSYLETLLEEETEKISEVPPEENECIEELEELKRLYYQEKQYLHKLDTQRCFKLNELTEIFD